METQMEGETQFASRWCPPRKADKTTACSPFRRFARRLTSCTRPRDNGNSLGGATRAPTESYPIADHPEFVTAAVPARASINVTWDLWRADSPHVRAAFRATLPPCFAFFAWRSAVAWSFYRR